MNPSTQTSGGRRASIGTSLLGGSFLVAVVTAVALARGGVRQELFIGAGAFTFIAFTGGAFLLITPPQPVSTARVAAWSIPGLAILLTWSMVLVANWAERVIPVSTTLLGGIGICCGPVSPLTSIAATVLVVRMPSPVRATLTLGSWVGAIMFWANVFGVLPGQ